MEHYSYRTKKLKVTPSFILFWREIVMREKASFKLTFFLDLKQSKNRYR